MSTFGTGTTTTGGSSIVLTAFSGTNGVQAGTDGLVPGPAVAQQGYLLGAGGDWTLEVKAIADLNDSSARIATTDFVQTLIGQAQLGGNANLSALGDTQFAGLVADQFLQYNGNKWVNVTFNLDSIADVDLAGLQDGNALVYDATANGGAGGWVPGQGGGGGVANLTDLGDVTINGGAENHFLVRNAQGQYVNRLISTTDLSNSANIVLTSAGSTFGAFDYDFTGVNSITVKAPTADAHASTKKYVDDSVATKQPLEATLTGLANLAPVDGDIIIATGNDTFGVINVSANVETFLGSTANLTALSDVTLGGVGLANGQALKYKNGVWINEALDFSELSGTANVALLDANQTFTGTVLATTQAVNDNTTKLATTAYVEAQIDNDITALNLGATYQAIDASLDTITGIVDGDLLLGNGANSFEKVNVSAGVETILKGTGSVGTLSDVNLAGVGDGKILKYNNGSFVVADETDTQLSAEQVEDIVGPMFTANNAGNTGITFSYDDTEGGNDGTITATVSLASTDLTDTANIARLNAVQTFSANATFTANVDLTGATATAFTQNASNNSTSVATTAYVDAQIDADIGALNLGATYQGINPKLTSISGLNIVDGSMIIGNGANSFEIITIQGGVENFLKSTGRIASLSDVTLDGNELNTANHFIVSTGAGGFQNQTISTANLSNSANIVLTSAGATFGNFTYDFATSATITVDTPTAGTHAANKAYVDAKFAGGGGISALNDLDDVTIGAKVDAQILVLNYTNDGDDTNDIFHNVSLSGDLTITNAGVATIANNAVTTAKILDGNVTDAKLANDSVTTAKILDANVTNAKLADDSVTTAKILDGNVTTAKILDANVTDAKLANDSVTTAKILDANVTTAKILDANVTDAKLANDSVTTAKILDANVTDAKLANDSVTTAKILDANVTNAKLANSSLTVGSTAISLGGSSTTLSGMTGIDFTNANATIGATMTTNGGASTTLTLGGAGSKVIISGDLQVSGTTTTVDTTNMVIEDRVISLNSGVAGANTDDIGLFFDRGTSDPALFIWDESNDVFKVGTQNGATASQANAYNLSLKGLQVASPALGDDSNLASTTAWVTDYFQPLDATLTALAGVVTVADKLIYATAADTFTTTDITEFARSILDDADAGAVRTTLGLGTASTKDIAFFLEATDGLNALTDVNLGVKAGDNTSVALANAQILIYDDDAGAEDDKWKNKSLSGDITISNTGVATIANSAVSTAKINNGGVTNAKLANDAVTTAKILDGNVSNAKLANSSLTVGSTAISLGGTSTTLSGMTGIDFTAGNASIASSLGANTLTLGGAASIVNIAGNITLSNAPTAGSHATTKTYVDTAVDTAVSAITFDDLTDVNLGVKVGDATSVALANAQILVYDSDGGNENNKWKNVSLSSDLTITNAGVATIANSAVSTAKLANDSVTTAKILDANVSNAKLANSSLTVGSTAISLGGSSTTLSGMTGIDFTNANATIGGTMTTDGANPTTLTLGGVGSKVVIAGSLEVTGTLNESLNSLSDVTINNPDDKHFLVSNGAGAFSNRTISTADLSNSAKIVLTSAGSTFGAFAYDFTASTVSVKAPTADAHASTKKYVDDTVSAISFDGLTDVNLGVKVGDATSVALTNAQILIYDDDTGDEDNKWKNKSLSGDITISNAGVATIGNGKVTNIKLDNSSLTVGSTSISLGGTSTTLSGMTGIDFTNANATIGATMTDDGAGTSTTLTLGGAGSTVAITGTLTVNAPANDTDASTKKYVDDGLATKQPLDATLTALAGVATDADKLIYATAADTFTTTDITEFARSILDDADVGTVRATLGLGDAALVGTTETGGVDNNGKAVITDAEGKLGAIDGSNLTALGSIGLHSNVDLTGLVHGQGLVYSTTDGVNRFEPGTVPTTGTNLDQTPTITAQSISLNPNALVGGDLVIYGRVMEVIDYGTDLADGNGDDLFDPATDFAIDFGSVTDTVLYCADDYGVLVV